MSGTLSTAKGTFAALPISTGYFPQEGSRCVTAYYDWTSLVLYKEDLSYLAQARGPMETIQSAYIDNSAVPFSVAFLIRGTRQRFVVPALSFAYLPVFFTGGAHYEISSSSVTPNTTTVILLNIPCSNAMIWGATGGLDPSTALILAAELPPQGEIPFVVDTPQAAQRALKINATVAGTVSFNYADGSTGSVIVNAGTSIYPGYITRVNSAGTTATATYSNIK